jgi:hypothetical protein
MRSEAILAVLASLTLTACGDKWDAYVYPDKTRLSASAHLGPFESLAECRAAASARLAEFSRQTLPGIVGDYECGKNCDGGKRLGGVAVCDETVR